MGAQLTFFIKRYCKHYSKWNRIKSNIYVYTYCYKDEHNYVQSYNHLFRPLDFLL